VIKQTARRQGNVHRWDIGNHLTIICEAFVEGYSQMAGCVKSAHGNLVSDLPADGVPVLARVCPAQTEVRAWIDDDAVYAADIVVYRDDLEALLP